MLLTKHINFDIYKQEKELLNTYNKKTLKHLNELEQLIQQDIFEVPSYIRNTIWGYERIFYPFTNKLMKVVVTEKEETSCQLHPRKNEIWYPIKPSIVYDGKEYIETKLKEQIIIPKNSVHSMQKGGKIFEVQDNTLYDNDETIRIFDKSGRKVHKKQDYMNYLLPHNINKVVIKKHVNKNMKTKFFLFIIKGEGRFGKIKLEENKLYFIKNSKNLKVKGNYVKVDAYFYEQDNLFYREIS